MSVPSSRRYLSLWLRRLSTDRIERHSSEPVESLRRRRVDQGCAAHHGADRRRGAARPQGRHGARRRPRHVSQRCRSWTPIRRPTGVCSKRIADWCDRYTPLVGLDAPDGLLLDVTGCAHLFGGEAALARDLVARLAQQGLRVRAAVADTVGCAWGVARYGNSQTASSRAAKPQRRCLPLPIAALRVDAETVADLKTAGLTCVADLATRPRAPFAARFGKALLLRLDQALGRADEPITPRLPVPAAMAEQRFPEPIAREADVLGTIEHLARQLVRCAGAARRGRAAVPGGAVSRRRHGASAGDRHRRAAARSARACESCSRSGSPCSATPAIRASATTWCGSRRWSPSAAIRRRPGLRGPDHAEELAHLIDRLGARFGLRRVTRLVPQDTHIPEYAVATVPAHAPRSAAVRRAVHRAGHAFRRPPASPVRSAGADRRHRPGAGRSARAILLAARDASGRAGRRARAHRHGMVARRPRQQAHARLFPCRKQSRRAGVALPRRASTAASEPAETRAGICMGCLRECEVMSAYAELAVTTNFSFLRGASDAEELVLRAKELGLIGHRHRRPQHCRRRGACACDGEDHRIEDRCRRAAGFQRRIPRHPCLSADRAAWGRLTRLLTLGKDRAEKGDCILGLPDLLEDVEGLNLIVMPPARINADALVKLLRRIKETSRRSVWLAASMLYRGDDRRRLVKLRDIADAALVPLIAVNDVLYHAPERRALQDVVTCIREHRTLEEAGRLLEANAERHLKSADEMTRLFGAASKAVEQTARFFKRCRFSLDELQAPSLPERIPARLCNGTGGAGRSDARREPCERYPRGMSPHMFAIRSRRN